MSIMILFIKFLPIGYLAHRWQWWYNDRPFNNYRPIIVNNMNKNYGFIFPTLASLMIPDESFVMGWGQDPTPQGRRECIKNILATTAPVFLPSISNAEETNPQPHIHTRFWKRRVHKFHHSFTRYKYKSQRSLRFNRIILCKISVGEGSEGTENTQGLGCRGWSRCVYSNTI